MSKKTRETERRLEKGLANISFDIVENKKKKIKSVPLFINFLKKQILLFEIMEENLVMITLNF